MIKRPVILFTYFVLLSLISIGSALIYIGFRDNQLTILVTGLIITIAMVLMFVFAASAYHNLCENDDVLTARPPTGIPTIIIDSDNPVNVVYREREREPKIMVIQEHDPIPNV